MTALEYANRNKRPSNCCPSDLGIKCEGEVECSWEYLSISCGTCWNTEIVIEEDK
jgi:hypothetical protein